MAARFTELAGQLTPMGDLSLRRRVEPRLGVEVYEVLLDGEYLMSSLFTVAEVELARLGLAAHAERHPGAAGAVDVVVGGLGLGCTAAAALEDPRVGSLVVVDALPEVIDWHRRGLLPLSATLTGDPRCTLVAGDFFARAAALPRYDSAAALPLHDSAAALPQGAGAEPLPLCDVVLLDVDHTPRHVLHPSHAAFYTAGGLAALAGRLRPGGVFALWSDDPPDDAFVEVLGQVFAAVEAEVVRFPNPLTGGESANTVYTAVRERGATSVSG